MNYIHFLIYFRRRERNIDLLFHLVMYSLMDYSMYPEDWTQKLGISWWCSNQGWIISTLQIRKLKIRWAKTLAQGHTAGFLSACCWWALGKIALWSGETNCSQSENGLLTGLCHRDEKKIEHTGKMIDVRRETHTVEALSQMSLSVGKGSASASSRESALLGKHLGHGVN